MLMNVHVPLEAATLSLSKKSYFPEQIATLKWGIMSVKFACKPCRCERLKNLKHHLRNHSCYYYSCQDETKSWTAKSAFANIHACVSQLTLRDLAKDIYLTQM
ncbi:hypothetical protein PUN28_014780 [Cardiocondyla obscurior]|uniref:Transposase n=1 Tax=Cardiocondyla obscurior TaxID=286306 RepID=A0AAW2EVD0_9HYME